MSRKYPNMMPYITVADVDKAIEFYEKAFGFGLLEKAPSEDNTTLHAELSYRDQVLMLGKAGAYGGKTQSPKETKVESPIGLYLYTDDVDEFYKAALANNAKSASEPEDMFWGDRTCRLEDLDGYIWTFATHIS